MTHNELVRERQVLLEKLTVLDEALKEQTERLEAYQDLAGEVDSLMRDSIESFRNSDDRHFFHGLADAQVQLTKRTVASLYQDQDDLSHRRRQLLSSLEQVDSHLKRLEKEAI